MTSVRRVWQGQWLMIGSEFSLSAGAVDAV